MKFGGDDELTGMLRVDNDEKMLIISEYGYGKRVEAGEFSAHGRGTGGQRIYTVSEKTGEIVGCVNVLDNEEIMCITSQGKSIKLKVDSIRVMGRSAQGVRILSIDKPDFVIGIDRIVKEEESIPQKSDDAPPQTEEAEAPVEPEDTVEPKDAEDKPVERQQGLFDNDDEGDSR
jgi:DNA gyrase subunit A